jgi:hypothetical protein
MCTVSFLPTAAGYRLAMNRDEKRTRVTALPPEIFRVRERRAIYPREPNDGTWLAVNDAGLCLALINWHRIDLEPEGEPESRGRIIPQLIGASDGRGIGRELGRLSLGQVRPFRLIVIDAGRQTVTEWQWNTIALGARRQRWQIAHWFSSGYDELEAEREREKVCNTSSLGTAASLRKLHTSHLPKRGPFSICMHRPDAATVSFSEVIASRKRITLRYRAGPPCQGGDQVARWLSCSRDR